MANQNSILLNDIIYGKRFYHAFQPLFNLSSWREFGSEALLRCNLFKGPEFLFNVAMKNDYLYDLDISSVYNAVSTAKPDSQRLFINVYPSTIINPLFSSFLDKLQELNVSSQNIIFEINESEKILNEGLFKRVVRKLKESGYRIALDDIGEGKASLPFVTYYEPDFVKLDRYYGIGLASSIEKQEEVKTILELCNERNILLVLEGIEHETDLAIAKTIGVHLGQGFLLGKPLNHGHGL